MNNSSTSNPMVEQIVEKRLREVLGERKFDEAMKPVVHLLYETAAVTADLTDTVNAMMDWLRRYGPQDKLPELEQAIVRARTRRRILGLPRAPIVPFSPEHMIIEATAAIDEAEDGTASAYLLLHASSPIASDLAFMRFDGKDRGEAIKAAAARVMVSKQRAAEKGLYTDDLLADLPPGDVELPPDVVAHLQKAIASTPTKPRVV